MLKAVLQLSNYFYMYNNQCYFFSEQKKTLDKIFVLFIGSAAHDTLQTLVCLEQCTCSTHKTNCFVCLQESSFNFFETIYWNYCNLWVVYNCN